MNERVAVLGGGSWGATLAGHLCGLGRDVTIWEPLPDAAERLARTHRLPTLPALVLPDSACVTNDLSAALHGREVIVNAVPSPFVRGAFRAARQCGALSPSARVISVSKGIENDTLKRMTEVIEEEVPALAGRAGVLAGPSLADEVACGVPTAVVAAGPGDWPEGIVSLFNTDRFRVYSNPDFVGVELCGALKNVYAVACGISDGLGFGDNTKAALMTRGLNEMARLGVACGAQVTTFLGLAGLGDLIVTCASRQSRNRSFGEKVGSGKTAAQALAEMTMVVEGYPTAKSARQWMLRHGLDMPIVAALHAILYEGKPPSDALRDLMGRPPKAEMLFGNTFFQNQKER